MQGLFLSETSYAQKILIQCILDILHITSWEFQYAFILILLNELANKISFQHTLKKGVR